ncbi:MAG: hypothetical protein EON92_13785, partial [Burkholderiales bacterium]
MASSSALAALGASVTLVAGDPTDIYPGQTTRLQITLSNNNTAGPVSATAFSSSLPGSLPNGLRISGPATYTCAAAGGGAAPTSGTLTAPVGSQT